MWTRLLKKTATLFSGHLHREGHRQSETDWLATGTRPEWRENGIGQSTGLNQDEARPIATALQTLLLRENVWVMALIRSQTNRASRYYRRKIGVVVTSDIGLVRHFS